MGRRCHWPGAIRRDLRVLLLVTVTAVAATTVESVAAPAAEPTGCPRTPFDRSLDEQLRARWPSRRFTAAVGVPASGCTFHLHPRLRLTTASVFKLEVMTGVLLRAQDEHRAVTRWEHDRLVPMITQSANPPTNALYSYLGGTAGFGALNRRLGLTSTQAAPPVWGMTSTSAADQLHLVLQVLGDAPGPLAPSGRLRAWTYAGAVVRSQRWGVGDGAPAGHRVGMKNGFAPSRCCGWRLNSAGLVDAGNGRRWAIVILSDGWPSEAAGKAAVSWLGRRLNGHFSTASD